MLIMGGMRELPSLLPLVAFIITLAKGAEGEGTWARRGRVRLRERREEA